MCRLFALSAGRERVRATFWLLDAPDSLTSQSWANPDGTGLGWFSEADEPHVEKRAIAAYDDVEFARDARQLSSRTFVAHIRRASSGEVTDANTHPFTKDGLIFAHNGDLGGLPELDRHLGPDAARIGGQTDSERVFALIVRESRRLGGVTAGVVEAVRWIEENLPIYSLNFVMASANELWALRYPAENELFVLARSGGGELDQRSSLGLRVAGDQLAEHDTVIVASERLDANPGWRELSPGTLLHVAEDLSISETELLTAAPRHRRSRPTALNP